MHFARPYLILGIVLATMGTYTPAYAGLNDPWANALTQAAARSHPLASKLSLWFYASQKDTDLSAVKMMNFVRQNPGWPRLGMIREKIEHELPNANLDTDTTINWFKQYPPTTADGIRVYSDALLKQSQHADAGKALRLFWLEATLSRSEVSSLSQRYNTYLKSADHAARANNLIWDERYGEAQDMLPLLSDGQKKIADARLALARMLPNAETLVSQLSASAQNDEGVLFERLRWRRKKNLDDGAFVIIRDMPATRTRADKWWKEMNIMARRAFEAGAYTKAYDIATKHGLKASADFAQAEWFAGWIALRQLKQPEKAFHHFDTMYRSTVSAISHARAAYWAARAADAANSKEMSKLWDQTAARYLSTYYGQLSYSIVYGTPDTASLRDPSATEVQKQTFEKNELVQVIRFLNQLKLSEYTDPFFAKFLDQAKEPADFALIGKLAKEVGNSRYMVQANKDAQQKSGAYLSDSGYPVMSKMPGQPEKSLIHSIIYRESMFNTNASSPAGALGMMQLMPGTAKMMAKKANDLYTPARLTQDPAFNIRMGASYLQLMLDQYDGSYPLAIAAYNAGPGNVDKWIASLGDPRRQGVDLIDWLEQIPIYETRNYVQRVMETYYIYRMKNGKDPKTVLEWQP